ncbi:MAG TPA: YhdP family protein, partial [Quisquiliibacterium sp.]|nr:YhdP family protein [Quisquiliibacterium sp.]
RITQSGGELRVRASDATLAFPGVFAEPEIPLTSVLARASWVVGARARDAAGARVGEAAGPAPGAGADPAAVPGLPPLEVEVAELRFENADAAGTVSGRWRSGGKGAGVVDLAGSFERVRADRVARYLPLEIPDEIRGWVQYAIVGGRSDDVRFRVRGDLEDFPFERPADGEFAVDARLIDTALHYAPGWPAIEGFEGRLQFERNGMRVTMRSGRVFGVTLGDTRAVIADFDTPRLVVEGGGEGPAVDMIRFVNESPLATGIDDFTRDTQAQGNARLKLRLELPLDDLDATRVAGRVQFLGSSLTLDKTLPVFSGVTGALEFTESGLALRDLSASFLGGPLKVEGETTAPGRFAIRGEGRIGAEGMRTIADNPITRALSGETAYRVRIDVNRRASSLSIESDLVGMASSLPSPLAKREGERMPLLVETVADSPPDPQARPRGDTVRVRLGERLALALDRERDPGTEQLLVRRAALALDAEPVLPDAGLAVHLNAPEVDLDSWAPVFSGVDLPGAGEAPAEGFAAGFQLLPQTVTVQAQRVRVAGQELNDVTLGASRAGSYWRANIGAREVQGYFSWRRAAQGQRVGTLTGRFTRLELSRSRAGEVESMLDASPQELPGLDVAAEEFVLFDRRLGALSLRATNSAVGARPVWTLEELRLAHPSANFNARGTWAAAAFGSGRTTRLDFDLDLVDSGRLLDVFGLEDVMTGAAGRISGDLHWRGSPMAFDYPTLGGSMSLKLGKGRFLKKDPGIAKLIGVLNLQSLPRRLALDFSDVFSEGFAFDEIAGDVGIAGGVARTEDLVMRGLQARVSIHGSANIEEETQDLDVEVRPELNAGLASLAYGAMVSPVIGIGSFVAQMALRAPIQQIFSYEYEITGPWDDPKVVEKRRRAEPAAVPPTGE